MRQCQLINDSVASLDHLSTAYHIPSPCQSSYTKVQDYHTKTLHGYHDMATTNLVPSSLQRTLRFPHSTLVCRCGSKKPIIVIVTNPQLSLACACLEKKRTNTTNEKRKTAKKANNWNRITKRLLTKQNSNSACDWKFAQTTAQHWPEIQNNCKR